VKGGYIITIKPTAIGIEVVPMLNRLKKGTMSGMSHPDNTPTAIALKIHAVRYLSRKLSRLVVLISREPRAVFDHEAEESASETL
jgi:hypothetical protein